MFAGRDVEVAVNAAGAELDLEDPVRLRIADRGDDRGLHRFPLHTIRSRKYQEHYSGTCPLRPPLYTHPFA